MSTPTPSLECQLETAYATVAKACEPALAEITPTLSTLILAQAPQPGDDGSEPDTQLQPPYVLLKAKRLEAALQNRRGQTLVDTVELTIEAADNAADASADGGALDALFRSAAAPLFYDTITDDADPPVTRNLFEFLSDAVANFRCLGMSQCGNSEMENQGSIVRRWITATFLCQSLAA